VLDYLLLLYLLKALILSSFRGHRFTHYDLEICRFERFVHYDTLPADMSGLIYSKIL